MSESGNRLGSYQEAIAEYIGNERPTQGTETSKYLEENKTIVIPQVVASERGSALKCLYDKWNVLESTTKEGESPVHVCYIDIIRVRRSR